MTRTRTVAIAGGMLVLAVALAVRSIRGSATVSCEVCVRFHGHEACRSAAAASRDLAVRAATDAACSLVGKGLPERMQCRANPPERSSCRQR
jgi:hypothetical protein